jgi:predicted kinase
LPGSGKTYFAKKLAAKINGLHISSDTIRQQLQQQNKYQEQAKMDVYYEMLRLMEKAIHHKQNAVLDATFYKAMIRDLFKEKAGLLNSAIYFIEIQASQPVIQERVSRKRLDSDADFKVYLEIKQLFEPLKEDHLILCSSMEEDDMLHKSLAYINYPDEQLRN